MSTIHELENQIKVIDSIKAITEALGDIATTQIKSTRSTVEHNIHYFQEISEVYATIRMIANTQHLKVKNAKPKNGKTAGIAVTSNYPLYGDIDNRVMEFYLAEAAKIKFDRFIIGHTGQQFLESSAEKSSFSFISFKKDSPDFAELKAFTTQFDDYSKILLYHPKFVTLLTQSPTVSDISTTDTAVSNREAKESYLLEPEIDKMLEFFESQILLLLMQAIFLEADISRTASRMISMNQAEENAEHILESDKKNLSKMHKQKINKQILETLAGQLS